MLQTKNKWAIEELAKFYNGRSNPGPLKDVKATFIFARLGVSVLILGRRERLPRSFKDENN